MAKYEIKDGVGIIPEGTIEIVNGFDASDELTNVVIPNSVTALRSNAFSFCKNLVSVVIPDSVTSIGVAAFRGCEKLESIVIPDSVTEIREVAFDMCEALTTVTIGKSVRSIGYDAFQGCDNLKQIFFRIVDPALIQLEGGHNLGGYQATLYVPDKKSIAAFKKKAIWKKYAGIEVYETADDSLLKADKEREEADKAFLALVGMKDCDLQLAPIPADKKPEEILTVVYDIDESELPFSAVIDTQLCAEVGCMLIDNKSAQNFKDEVIFKKAGKHIIRLFPLTSLGFSRTFIVNGFPGSELVKYPDSDDVIDDLHFYVFSEYVPKKLLLGAGFNDKIPYEVKKYVKDIAVVPNNPYMEMQNGCIIRKSDKEVIYEPKTE